MSQLDLAVAAQVTPRHVSFVESGRARPSRDMVLILARAPDLTAAPLPVIPVQFRKDGLAVSYFSMVTTVGTPQDVTAEEIRLESFFPADQATEARRWT
jgi:transcriptional regulator with XRE-family HTH domain